MRKAEDLIIRFSFPAIQDDVRAVRLGDPLVNFEDRVKLIAQELNVKFTTHHLLRPERSVDEDPPPPSNTIFTIASRIPISPPNQAKYKVRGRLEIHVTTILGVLLFVWYG